MSDLYLESLVSRITNLYENAKDTFDVRNGFPFQELLSRSICFKLAGVSTEIQQFFVASVLSWISDYKMKTGTNGLEQVVCLDECHRFFNLSSRNRMDLGDPILWDLLRTFRKRGVGCILSTQTVSDLPVAILSNLGTRIALRTISGLDIEVLAQSMNLTPEQQAYLTLLDRQCVVSYLGYPGPVLVDIPEMDFSQKVSEQELQQRIQPVLAALSGLSSNGTGHVRLSSLGRRNQPLKSR